MRSGCASRCRQTVPGGLAGETGRSGTRQGAGPPRLPAEADDSLGCGPAGSWRCGSGRRGHARRRPFPQQGLEQVRPAPEAEPLDENPEFVEELAAGLRLEVAPKQRAAVVSALTRLQKRVFQLLGIQAASRAAGGAAGDRASRKLVTVAMFFAGRIVAGSAVADLFCTASSDLLPRTYRFGVTLATAWGFRTCAVDVGVRRIPQTIVLAPELPECFPNENCCPPPKPRWVGVVDRRDPRRTQVLIQ